MCVCVCVCVWGDLSTCDGWSRVRALKVRPTDLCWRQTVLGSVGPGFRLFGTSPRRGGREVRGSQPVKDTEGAVEVRGGEGTGVGAGTGG